MATHHSDVKIVSVDVVKGCHDPDVDDWLNEYEEKEVNVIEPSNSKLDGIHTYNFDKNIICIDGKIKKLKIG